MARLGVLLSTETLQNQASNGDLIYRPCPENSPIGNIQNTKFSLKPVLGLGFNLGVAIEMGLVIQLDKWI